MSKKADIKACVVGDSGWDSVCEKRNGGVSACETFAHHTGLSPHQYRIQIKLGRARTLLSETALTVKEVA